MPLRGDGCAISAGHDALASARPHSVTLPLWGKADGGAKGRYRVEERRAADVIAPSPGRRFLGHRAARGPEPSPARLAVRPLRPAPARPRRHALEEKASVCLGWGRTAAGSAGTPARPAELGGGARADRGSAFPIFVLFTIFAGFGLPGSCCPSPAGDLLGVWSILRLQREPGRTPVPAPLTVRAPTIGDAADSTNVLFMNNRAPHRY